MRTLGIRNKHPVNTESRCCTNDNQLVTNQQTTINQNHMKLNFTRTWQIPWRAAWLLGMLLILVGPLSAQVPGYSFSESTITYTPITGGTVHNAGTWDDNNFLNIPIGFTFRFDGTDFTALSIQANGWIRFGTTIANSYTPISGAPAGTPLISGFGRDLQAIAGVGEIRSQLVGTAPNRTFVIQWLGARKWNAAGDNFNFQIRLNEGGGVPANQSVQVFYGTNVSNATGSFVQVGLRGINNTLFNNRTTAWTGSTAGAVNNATQAVAALTVPPNGLAYTWTPPSPCVGAPSPGNTLSSLGAALCPSATTTLSLQNAPLVGSGYTYQWQDSPDGVTFNNIVAATAVTYVTPAFAGAPIWYRCVVTCTPSGLTTNSGALAVTVAPFYNCYCASSAAFTADTEMFQVTLGALNNTSTCATVGCGVGSIQNRYSNHRGCVAAPNVTQDISTPMSVRTGSCGGAFQQGFTVFIDLNGNGIFDAAERVFSSAAYTPPNANPGQTTNFNITIPGSSVTGLTGMRVILKETASPGTILACDNSNWGETEDYLINIVASSNCTGSPAASTTLSTPNPACSGATLNLSLGTSYSGAGISYQWQSSPDNVAWADFGTDSPTQTDVFSGTATYYRAQITCTFSGLTTNASSILVNPAPFFNCYCESAASSAVDSELWNVTLNTLNNTTNCASVGGAGSILGRYNNYKGLPATTLFRNTPYTFSARIGACGFTGYNNIVRVYIDYNQNGVFEAGEIAYTSPATLGSNVAPGTQVTGLITPPGTALLGQTGMRVVMHETTVVGDVQACSNPQYIWGETEDYLVEIAVPPACAGAPAASSASSSLSPVCPSNAFTLSLSTAYPFDNISYQWFSSPDNVTWTGIPGATNATRIQTQTAATWYRAEITCANSGLTTVSGSTQVLQNALFTCYCASGATNGGDTDIGRFQISTLNNNQPSPCTVAPGAGSVLGSYSNWTTLPAPDVDKGIPTPITIGVGSCGLFGYDAIAKVFIDYNQNGTFEGGELAYTSNIITGAPNPGTLVTANITIPLSALDGQTLLRVVLVETTFAGDVQACGTYTWGETEDYIVNLTTPPACAGTPDNGTVPATLTTLNNVPVTINAASFTAGLGVAYAWEFSTGTAAGPYNPVVGGSGDGTPSYTTPGFTGQRWYRMRTLCSFSGLDAVSNACSILPTGGASCGDPFIVNTYPFVANLTTVGSGNNHGAQASTCSNSYGTGNDFVFQLNIPAPGLYEIGVVNTAFSGWIGWFLKNNGNCALTTLASNVACAVSGGGNVAFNTYNFPSAGTYFLVVDYFPAPFESPFYIKIRQVPAPPANDNCGGATSLTHFTATSCTTPTLSSTGGATSSTITDGAPAACTGNADDDVWFSFVATGEGALIDVTPNTIGFPNTGANIAFQVYSGGACGTLVSLGCINGNPALGGAEAAVANGLVTGETYFVRVWDVNAGYGIANGDFSICVYTPPPPANDDCLGAISLTISANCTPIVGTTIGASQSLPASNCSGWTGNADDDVWYSFNLAAPADLNFDVLGTVPGFDAVLQLYSGSCGTLTNITCNDLSLAGGRERIFRSLPAGPYFLRVFHYGVGTGGGGFNICAYTTAPAVTPVNDNTCDATLITYNTVCSPSGPFQSQNATRTYVAPGALQVGDANDDVWYRFVATTGFATINVQPGSGYDAVFQVFEMSNCKTITGIYAPVDGGGANTIETQTIFGLNVGSTYYIRVYDFFAGNPAGNFTVCVFQTPAPANNLCVGAELVIQQNAATCQGVTQGFTGNATPDVPAGPCGGTANDDVWYRFTAASPNPTITVTGTQGFRPVIELRSGPVCGSFVACNAAPAPDGTATINAAGLTVGAEYRVRVYSFGGTTADMGTFELCIFGIAVPPPNDNCAGAILLPNASPCLSVSGYVSGATQSLVGCTGTANNDVWYSFVASNTTATITVTGLGGFNAVVQAFSGTCGTLAPIGACQNATGSGGTENLILSGLTPNTTYYVRTYDFFAGEPTSPLFNICFTGQPPVNNNICGAININPTETGTPVFNGTNLGATNSSGPPVACFASFQNDVWYSALVPANGVLAVNVRSITVGDTRLRVYTSSDNTCTGVLTNVACDDDGGPGLGSFAYITGLTPGDRVFFVVDAFGALGFGNFDIQVTDGWVWTGANGFAFNGTGNWFNQNAGEGFPAPGNTTIVNIPLVGAVNQPIVTANTTVGGVKFIGSSFLPSQITANTGIIFTVNGSSAVGRGVVLSRPSGGRFNGPGRFVFQSSALQDISFTGLGNARFFTTASIDANTNINSNGKMIFENGTALYAGGVHGNVNGNITYRRNGDFNQFSYNYWSAPVSGAPLSSISGFYGDPALSNLYQYNAAISPGLSYDDSQLGWVAMLPSDIMTPGRGYISTGQAISTFVGPPNQINTTIAGLVGGGGNNFNLVGNPFPAPLNSTVFLGDNAARINGGALYIWDDDNTGGSGYTSGDYIVVSGLGSWNVPNAGGTFDGHIGSAQGFFVLYNPASGPITFNLAARSPVGTSNASFFETFDFSRLLVRVSNQTTNQKSESMIAFHPDATDGYDQTLDVVRLPGNPELGLFTFIGDTHYAGQAFPPLTSERIIPLGLVNTVAGQSMIEAIIYENFDASTVVYLEDMELGVFHNMATGPYSYSNSSLTASDARFRLHFRAPVAVSATMACAGEATGKIVLSNPNNTPVAVEVLTSANEIAASLAPFVGETIVNNLVSDNYTVKFNYTDGTNVEIVTAVESNSITSPASMIASSYNVSIVDAIVEFQGIASGATELTWDFGDGTIVTGDINPVHAYMTPGIFTVTFTATNNGCSSTVTSTVTVTDVPTGINTVNRENGFTIFPNPAATSAQIALNLDRTESSVTLSIHDAAGRLVSTEVLNDVRSGSIHNIKVDGLANGVYQITVEGNKFREVGRLTIAK